MTTTAPASASPLPKIVTPCAGTGVLAAVALVDGRVEMTYPACPGCNDCDREVVRGRMVPMSAEQAFARLPMAPVDEEW